MSEKTGPPETTYIDDATMEQLNDAVAESYRLMKEGKTPDRSPEAAAALQRLRSIVEGKLRYDEELKTWVDK